MGLHEALEAPKGLHIPSQCKGKPTRGRARRGARLRLILRKSSLAAWGQRIGRGSGNKGIRELHRSSGER